MVSQTSFVVDRVETSKVIEISSFSVSIKSYKENSTYQAIIKMYIDGDLVSEVAEGDNEVDALCKATYKALGKKMDFVLTDSLITIARLNLFGFIEGICS